MDRLGTLSALSSELVDLYKSISLSDKAAVLSQTLDGLILMIGRTDGLTVAQLAQLSGVTSGAVTQNIVALEERGLISRTHPEADRRYTIVTLTDAGRDAHDSIASYTLELISGVFAPLSNADLQVFASLIAKLRS